MAAEESTTVAAPGWLRERFPQQHWSTLRRCTLRVDAELGAGLDLEETEGGYHVGAVAAEPGQDAALQQGDVIISIGGVRLLGLPEVGELFGEQFVDGAELLLLHADELREATIAREANEECPCEEEAEPGEEEPGEAEDPRNLANYELLRRQPSETEREATVRIPVGRGTVWSLPEEMLASLEADLNVLGQRFGLAAWPELNREGSVQNLVLKGFPRAIAAARTEATQLLGFYRSGGSQAASPTLTGVANAASEEAAGQPLLKVPKHIWDLGQFQYHDHTADIIVHSWGKSRSEAFAQVCVGMFQYMTELSDVEPRVAVEVEAVGHDLLDLLYHLLDEFLFVFSTQLHVSRCVEVLEFDEEGLRVRARGYGEAMNLGKHSQGTEIKAITMHMMRILGPDTVITENGTVARAELGQEVREGFPHEVYVLLDI